jgi:AcrR family transcriptional regulator
MRENPTNETGVTDAAGAADGPGIASETGNPHEVAAAGFGSFAETLNEERYAHFRAISPDKQQLILRAALDEFASHDYALASTNTIVKRAGISKGLLFHYFGDKAGLYDYLFSHVVTVFIAKALAYGLPAAGDVFEIMKQLVRAKLETTADFMVEANFVLRAMHDTLPAKLHETVKLSIDKAFNWQSVIINMLDSDLLRPGIDREQAVCVIEWVCTGLVNEYTEIVPGAIDLDYWEKATVRVDSYLDLLRELFYRQPPKPPKEGDRHECA